MKWIKTGKYVGLQRGEISTSLHVAVFTHIVMELFICMVDKIARSKGKKGVLEVGPGQTIPSFPFGASVIILHGQIYLSPSTEVCPRSWWCPWAKHPCQPHHLSLVGWAFLLNLVFTLGWKYTVLLKSMLATRELNLRLPAYFLFLHLPETCHLILSPWVQKDWLWASAALGDEVRIAQNEFAEVIKSWRKNKEEENSRSYELGTLLLSLF